MLAAVYQTTQQRVNNIRQCIASGDIFDVQLWKTLNELKSEFRPPLSLFTRFLANFDKISDQQTEIHLAHIVFTNLNVDQKTAEEFWDILHICSIKFPLISSRFPDFYGDITAAFHRFIQEHSNPRKIFEVTCERLQPWMFNDKNTQTVLSAALFNPNFDYTSVLQQISNSINPAAIGYQKLLFERVGEINRGLYAAQNSSISDYSCTLKMQIDQNVSSNMSPADIESLFRLYLTAYGAGKSSRNCSGQFMFYAQLFEAAWGVDGLSLNDKLGIICGLHELLIEYNVVVLSILQHEQYFKSHWASFVASLFEACENSDGVDVQIFPRVFKNILQIDYNLLNDFNQQIWKVFFQAGAGANDACLSWLCHWHSLGELDAFVEQIVENLPSADGQFDCIAKNPAFLARFSSSVTELTENKRSRVLQILLDSILTVFDQKPQSKKRKRSKSSFAGIESDKLDCLAVLFVWARAGCSSDSGEMEAAEQKLQAILDHCKQPAADLTRCTVLLNIFPWEMLSELNMKPEDDVSALLPYHVFKHDSTQISPIISSLLDLSKQSYFQLVTLWLPHIIRMGDTKFLSTYFKNLVWQSATTSGSTALTAILTNLHLYEILPDPGLIVEALIGAWERLSKNGDSYLNLSIIISALPWNSQLQSCGAVPKLAAMIMDEWINSANRSSKETAEIIETALLSLLPAISVDNEILVRVQNLINDNCDTIIEKTQSVLSALIAAIFRTPVKVDCFLKFLITFMSKGKSKRIAEWLQIVLQVMTAEDIKSIASASSFIRRVRSFCAAVLIETEESYSPAFSALLLRYCQLTDDKAFVDENIDRVKSENFALTILAYFDCVKSDYLRGCNLESLAVPTVKAIARSSAHDNLWLEIINNCLFIERPQLQLLSIIINTDRRSSSIIQSTISTILDKMQSGNYDSTILQFFSSLLSKKDLKIFPLDMDRIFSLAIPVYTQPLDPKKSDIHGEQRIRCEFLQMLVKRHKKFSQSRAPQIITLAIPLLNYYRLKLEDAAQVSTNANLFYRLIGQLCSPSFRPAVKKHMMLLVSTYANIVASPGYSNRPFLTECRSWIRESMYCAFDASGNRDVENTRALCGMDARLVLKSLWEDYQKFFKFKGKV